MTELEKRIKKDIKAIASIYPSAFDLYDEPLNRLAQRIESTVYKYIVETITTKEHNNG